MSVKHTNEKNMKESAIPSPRASQVNVKVAVLEIDTAILCRLLFFASIWEKRSKNAKTQKLAPSIGAPSPEKYTSQAMAPRPLSRTAAERLLINDPTAYIKTAKNPKASSAVSAGDDEKEKCDGSILFL